MDPPRHLIGFAALLCLLIGGPLVAWRVACMLYPLRWTIAAVLAVTEWCFYIFYFRRTYEDFNRIPAVCRPKGFTPADGRKNWKRFLHTVRAVGGVDPRPYLQPWFLGAPYEDIKRGNIEEMLVYGFYYAKRDEMKGDLARIPGQMVDELQLALNTTFPPGYTPNLPFMSHLWEDLRADYRPLCLYLFFEALYGAQRLIMASYGFRAKKMGLLGYYTLNCGLDFPRAAANGSAANGKSALGDHEDDDWTPFAAPAAPRNAAKDNPLDGAVPNSDKATPVMFLHGVGGLMLYLEMLKHVIGLGHPVIVIEYKHVAMRLSSYIPTVDEVTRQVVDILDFEGIPRVCVVGHSYGSFMASRLNALHREYVHSLCLIDPVCLGMFMPSLLHNFMYRRPRIDWKHPDVLIRDLALWFASRDVHISATFARRFYWTDLNLWPEDLPPGSCVVLSGNDDLCHAEEVKKMIDATGQAKVILNPNLFHGAFLLDPSTKAHLMVEVRALLASSGSLVVRLARPVMDRTLSAARSLLQEVETLKTRLSLVNPHSHHQQQHPQRDNSRTLRRTVTDLPAHAWQRISSFGTGSRQSSFTSRQNSPVPVQDGAADTATPAATAAGHDALPQQNSLGMLRAAAAAAAAASGITADPATDSEGTNSSSIGAQQLPQGMPAAAPGAAPSAAIDDAGGHQDGSKHKKNLSTIPSMSDLSVGSSELAASGGSSGSSSQHADATAAPLPAVSTGGKAGEDRAAPAASRCLSNDVAHGYADKQQQQQQEKDAGCGDCGNSGDQAKQQAHAEAGLPRRACTSPAKLGMLHQQQEGGQQEDGGEEEQHGQALVGDQSAAMQLQQEAAELQKVLQQAQQAGRLHKQ